MHYAFVHYGSLTINNAPALRAIKLQVHMTIYAIMALVARLKQ